MSELMNMRSTVNSFRGRLLTTVSTVALLVSVGVSQGVKAADADADHPIVWIELGGQFEQQTGQGDAFVPSFIANNLSAPAFQGFDLQSQKAALFSTGLEGKLTFEPSGTDWVFSAAIRYGRANASKNINHTTAGHFLHSKLRYFTYPPGVTGRTFAVFHCCKLNYHTASARAFANMQTDSHQSQMIVDFQAGRDVGVGLFGNGSSSVVSAGVRIAQFVSRSGTTIHARPDVEFQKLVHQHTYYGFTYTNYREVRQFKHRYAASANTTRNFHGIGPAISWNGSTPLLGNPQAGEIAFDWGANAAVLFGRQKASGSHQTYQIYLGSQTNAATVATHYTHAGNFNRKRTVTVPNVGGLAGISFRYANAKVSFGYRGDFFFGAMDVGNDTRKTETVGFYGPFASVSIGFGG